MLGPPKPRRRDHAITVSPEDLVPPSNVYRHVETRLDLNVVRGWVSECYVECGRPSLDPVVFFTLKSASRGPS